MWFAQRTPLVFHISVSLPQGIIKPLFSRFIINFRVWWRNLGWRSSSCGVFGAPRPRTAPSYATLRHATPRDCRLVQAFLWHVGPAQVGVCWRNGLEGDIVSIHIVCMYIYIYILYLYGYGSIPINTIFRGMNIHLPAILMFTRGTRFWHTAIYIYI